MDIMADHRWRFHSPTGKTTGTLQGITDTGSRITEAIRTIGAPMTVDPSTKGIANMGTHVATAKRGNGNSRTVAIMVTGGAITAVKVDGDTKRTFPQHA